MDRKCDGKDSRDTKGKEKLTVNELGEIQFTTRLSKQYMKPWYKDHDKGTFGLLRFGLIGMTDWVLYRRLGEIPDWK
jgi:hypothetical protein